MKSVSLFVFLFSFFANACPDLSGQYTCEFEGEKQALELTQTVKDGVTTYSLNGEIVSADGNAYPMEDEGFIGTMTSVCGDNDDLLVHIVGDLYNEGQAVGTADIGLKFTANQNGLTQENDALYVIDGQPYQSKDIYFCSRN